MGECGFDGRIDRRAVLAGLFAAACAPAARARGAAVGALLARYVEERKIAGACAVIARDGVTKTISRGALALGGAPVDDRTLWRIFSMTKPVTGVAALALVDDGKLSLDTAVADIVSAFRAPGVLMDDGGTRPARGVMRVRHLLTHTAGLGYAINDDALAARYRDAGLFPGDPTPRETDPESLEAFGERLASLPLGYDPGARHQYSVSLDLLGLVIQRASGEPFETYLKRRLFAPLGMADTGFSVPPESRPRLAMNYGVRNGALVPLEPPDRSPYWAAPRFPSGGGGLLSSASDYHRFCTMLLNGGVLDGARILRPRTARLAHANLLPRGVLADGNMAFGAGMGIITRATTYDAVRAPGAYFWGGAAGTIMWIDPANRLTAVLMTQFMPSRAWPLWREFGDAVYAA